MSELAATLQNTASNNNWTSSHVQTSNPRSSQNLAAGSSNQRDAASGLKSSPGTNSTDNQTLPPATVSVSAGAASDPQYLALCVNTREFEKILDEIEVSDVTSDAELFNRLRSSYRNLRGFRSRFLFLIQPIAIRFVHVSTLTPLLPHIHVVDFSDFSLVHSF